jgi:hypothetical protein
MRLLRGRAKRDGGRSEPQARRPGCPAGGTFARLRFAPARPGARVTVRPKRTMSDIDIDDKVLWQWSEPGGR